MSFLVKAFFISNFILQSFRTKPFYFVLELVAAESFQSFYGGMTRNAISTSKAVAVLSPGKLEDH